MSSEEDVVVNQFVAFSDAGDLPDAQASFNTLCDLIDVDPSCYKNFYPLLKSKLTQWKCKALWKLLDARAALPEYTNQTACKGKRVLIVGAGPVGLRLAVEAALLGAEVDVVEKRGSFSRNNVLHLWPFLIDDLRALGAKRFYGKFCAGAIDHVCIRTVQTILLKVALVLGVKVHFPVQFVDFVEPHSSASDGWGIIVEPKIPSLSQRTYDAILSADGKQHSLKTFESKEFRAKLAIAITANFVNNNTSEEAAVEEISGVAYIYNQSFFKSLSQQYGIDLENIVYYKDETHYFVMTAKKSSLLAKGVLKKDHSDLTLLLSRGNINQTALEQYAMDAASYSTKGGLKNLQFAINHRGNHDVAIFDFTSLFASKHASMIMERQGRRLLMCVTGDTLLEPFWPTGSGLARGFLGAFDAAWMLKQFCEGSKSPLELIEERETLFHLLPSTTPERLQKKTGSYTLNPHSRYPNLNLLVPPTDCSHLYNTDTQIPEIRKPEIQQASSLAPPPSDSKIMRFHSVGAEDGRKLQPIKRKHEEAAKEEPPTPPEIIDDTNIEPYTPSHESSLLKFAKKLFGIRSTPKHEPKTEGQKQSTERKQSVSSPRKSPKKKRRRSKATPQHGSGSSSQPVKQDTTTAQVKVPAKDASTDQLTTVKHMPSSNHDKKPGVSELAQFYESGRTNTTQNKPSSRNGGATRPAVSKVSVASVIERLEKHKKNGVDMTDYEKSLAVLMNEGIEEVDAIVLDDMDKLVQQQELNGERRNGEEKKQENGGTVLEDIGTSNNRMRPESTEILDEDVSPLATNGCSVAMSIEEKGSTKQEENSVEDTPNETTGENQSLSVVDSGTLPCQEDKAVTNETKIADTPVKSDNDINGMPPITSATPTLRQSSLIEERKLQMGLSTETKISIPSVVSKERSDKPAVCRLSSPVNSPIRSGSKDDSVIKLKTSSETRFPLEPSAPPTSSWKKRFVDNLNRILEQFRNETDLQNVKIALEVIKFIYGNIVQDPMEDTYRRIRISSARFMQCVWRYEYTKLYFLSCSWMEVDDYLVLPMSQSLDAAQSVLNRQIETVDMMLHSKHITHLIQQQAMPTTAQINEEDKYTDSMVLMGVKKANLDYSIKLAQDTKAHLPMGAVDRCSSNNSTESTDHPWITRKEVDNILESAANAREWWENMNSNGGRDTAATLSTHASNYSLYFRDEELDILTHIGQEMRGRVAERVRNFQQGGDSMASDTSSMSSTDDEEEEEEEEETVDGCHGDGNHGDVKIRNFSGSNSTNEGEVAPVINGDVPVNTGTDRDLIRMASQEARNAWKKRDEGISSNGDSSNVSSTTVIMPSLSDTDPNLQKWEAAQRNAACSMQHAYI